MDLAHIGSKEPPERTLFLIGVEWWKVVGSWRRGVDLAGQMLTGKHSNADTIRELLPIELSLETRLV